MKRVIAWFIIMIMLVSSAGAAGIFLPASLTAIEEEAFMNDASVSGVISVPENVKQIGKDAFSNTGLFALTVPAGVMAIGQQSFRNAAYILFEGASTAVGSFAGVCYLIGPDQSSARTYAEQHGLAFVPASALVEHDGFYYRKSNGQLTLMSAVDPDQLQSEVRIPEIISGTSVSAVSSFAFTGCANVRKVTMPEELLQSWEQTEHPSLPGIEFVMASDALVKRVTASATSGTVGQSITWTVETAEGEDITQYSYSLLRNGEVIDEAVSENGTYTYAPESVGSYQLFVEVANALGETGSGSSQALYIAVESMKMSVAGSLQNGQDLTVQVQEVPGAIYYGVYLTEESTGKSLGYRSLTKPGNVTFRGYLLDNGTYRVTGYVYGNDFRYSVPTVKSVTVSGNKAEGPAIPDQQSIYYGSGFRVRQDDAEGYAVSCQCRYSDGTLSDAKTTYEMDRDIWVYPEGEAEKWADGGALLIRRAVFADNAWTAWGPVAEIEVLPAPRLAVPAVNAPTAGDAGKDLTVTFGSVENADWYAFRLLRGNHLDDDDYYEDEFVFGQDYRKGRTVVIPGYDLSAGEYTLRISAYSDSEEYYGSEAYSQLITLTGSRSAAPVVTPDKQERYVTGGSVRLTIQAPGAEAAYIDRVFYRNGYIDSRYSGVSIAINESGTGIYNDSENYPNDFTGCIMTYRVAALYDGVWSEIGTAEVLLKKQEPLPEPAVNAAETHAAGTDYTFRFSAVEGADSYRAYFYQSYSNDALYSWGTGSAKPDMDLSVPGYYLGQGNYRLVVRAQSAEYGNSETEVAVRVTGTRPSVPTVNVDLNEFHIKDRPVFTVNTTGAEELVVIYGESEMPFSIRGSKRIVVSNNNAETTWRYTIEESDLGRDYTFCFAVKKEGVWSSPREITRTILDLPSLDPPVLHIESVYEAGEDINISFDPVENAQSYRYTLSSPYTSTGTSCSEPKIITYRGSDYSAGTYQFELTARSDSYASSTATATFRITGSKAQWVQPAVTKTEGLTSEVFTFDFNTENVSQIRYKALMDDMGYDYSGTINVVENENTTRWSTEIHEPGNWQYFFSALINGRWTEWTEPIQIEITEESAVELPSLTVNDPHTLGRDLTVTIGPASTARSMHLYLYNSNGTRVASQSLDGNAGGTVTFAGYGLTLGTNRVHAEIYTGNTYYSLDRQFTVVSGTRPQAPDVIQETEIGRVDVRYGFTVVSSEAEKIAVRYYREDNTNSIYYATANATPPETSWSHYRGTAGQTWKYSFAVYVDGVWSPWSRSYQVTISDREQLATPEINADSTLEAGRDLYVSFDEVENADSYLLTVRYPDGTDERWYDATPGMEHRILGYDLNPGTYRIIVTASAADYESSTEEKTLSITSTRPSAPDVDVSTAEVFTGETFTFIIGSADAEEIAYRCYRNNGSSSGTLKVWADTTVWDTKYSSSGVVSYTFSILKDGKWSAWSIPKEITVNPRPVMQTPAVNVQEEISRGQNLTITVGSVENISYYYVYLYNNRGEGIVSKYLSEPGDVTISGYSLPLGSVRVEVYAYGSNNGSSRAVRNLTVNAGTLSDAPLVMPPESATVQAREYYSFTVQTEGAERAVVRYYRIGSPNDLNYSEFNTESGTTTPWRTYQYNGGNSYAYSFAVLRNGSWSEWSPFTVVTIE